MQVATERRFLRIDEVAQRLAVSASSIKRMIQRGEFPPPSRFGRLTRWSLEAIECWEEQQRQVA